jgi:hypothetical protein
MALRLPNPLVAAHSFAAPVRRRPVKGATSTGLLTLGLRDSRTTCFLLWQKLIRQEQMPCSTVNKHGKQKGKQLGNLIVSQIIGVVIGRQCGKYTQEVIGYSDGTQRNLATMAQDGATQEQLKTLMPRRPTPPWWT